MQPTPREEAHDEPERQTEEGQDNLVGGVQESPGLVPACVETLERCLSVGVRGGHGESL